MLSVSGCILWKTRRTVDFWVELVELYEYKVADMVAGRTPRGGKHALADLRQHLLSQELSAPLTRRLLSADRTYRQWRGAERAKTRVEQGAAPAGTVHNPTPPRLSDLKPQPVVDAAQGADLEAWRNLNLLAWHTEIRAKLLQLTRDLRHEAERPTLRVLYAVTENAERSLRGVSARFAVPAAQDPLVSLGDKGVVADITENFAELLLTPQGRAAVLYQLSQIQENPFPAHPDEELLREQLEAAEREHLTPQAREELMQALRARYPQAHDPHERPAVREAAKRLGQMLEPLLSSLPSGPMPHGSVLYGQTLSAAGTEPDPYSGELLIYLGSEVQDAYWQGLSLRWQEMGKNWQLQVGKQVLILYPHLGHMERRLGISEGTLILDIFYEGDYVLLRRQGQPLAPLGPLAAGARAAALLLDPAEDYAYLRLARATSQMLRGSPLNLAALAPETAEKFRQATPDDLQQFVRGGLMNLLARVAPTPPEQVRQTFADCAAALDIALSRAEKLHEALHNAAHSPETIAASWPLSHAASPKIVSASGTFQSFALGSDPLNIGIKGRLITVRRDYKNDLVVLLAGMPSMVLKDFSVVRLSDLSILLVHRGDWLAVAGVPHAEAEEDPDAQLLA
ncbi:hypothetical protein Dxin01_02483 [Deinococcus xinjiangensis]|uniref:DUF1631 family protein n=1 Tax=Deinococcus xinjiangensis TaxID=457454 RepID=A0ABP9VBY1_9DEIO